MHIIAHKQQVFKAQYESASDTDTHTKKPVALLSALEHKNHEYRSSYHEP